MAKISQTQKIQSEIITVCKEFPELDKTEVMNRVADRLEIPYKNRPSIRRAKGQLVQELKRMVEVLE